MRPTHLPGVVTVAVIGLVTVFGLLLAPGALASTAAARSAAVQASAQALRGGASHNEPIKCSDNLSAESTRVFTVICIVEDHPDVFRAAVAIASHYGPNFHGDIYLYFAPRRAALGKL
jgi:hypothetical protein